MIGSVTDHAVALLCYLLALKMDAWLLIGYGIPHGPTAYVLTCEYVKDTELPTYYVYDVFYNEKYNVTDSFCPLQKIYCLANGENVSNFTQDFLFKRITVTFRCGQIHRKVTACK